MIVAAAVDPRDKAAGSRLRPPLRLFVRDGDPEAQICRLHPQTLQKLQGHQQIGWFAAAVLYTHPQLEKRSDGPQLAAVAKANCTGHIGQRSAVVVDHDGHCRFYDCPVRRIDAAIADPAEGLERRVAATDAGDRKRREKEHFEDVDWHVGTLSPRAHPEAAERSELTS